MTIKIALLVVVLACTARPDPAVAELFAAMTGFEDQMCACKDKACTAKVRDKLNAWAASRPNSAMESPPPLNMSEADRNRFLTIGAAMNACEDRVTAHR